MVAKVLSQYCKQNNFYVDGSMMELFQDIYELAIVGHNNPTKSNATRETALTKVFFYHSHIINGVTVTVV